MADTPRDEDTTPAEERPPKLSASDFKKYNRMAVVMDSYHNHFRGMWNTMYEACSNNTRPSEMSLRQFVSFGLQFCSMLGMHHGIEERHIFPILAQKMPAFKEELHLLSQHKAIHKGLDQFEEYLRQCESGEQELRMNEMKRSMDTFGGVLWQHLDDEVAQLGAENMRNFWTLEEMGEMPL